MKLVKLWSDQAKAKAKVKIFVDLCNLFFHLFLFFLWSFSLSILLSLGVNRPLTEGINSSHYIQTDTSPLCKICVKTDAFQINSMEPLNIRWCSCTPMCHCLCDFTLSSDDFDFQELNFTWKRCRLDLDLTWCTSPLSSFSIMRNFLSSCCWLFSFIHG